MFKKIMLFFYLLFSVSVFANNPPKTVSQVNLEKYMGKWYEIASFPNHFQRGCQCTTADYKLMGNKVRVINRCYKGKKHKLSQVKGMAWVVPGSDNSKLKVRFFWPFKGDYWILYLSPGYKQVIVGTPNRKYLWILSRNRSIKNSLYTKLTQIAKSKGFKISRLVQTNQTCNGAL